MLHSLLAAAQARLGLEDHPWLDDALERGAVFALAFLVVDVFFCRGPLRGPLLRLFSQGGQSKDGQRRFLSQLAAKVIGIMFLSAIMPLAFQALADPALAGGDRFTATTPITWRMVEIGSGYFLYDIVICLLKFGGECAAAAGQAVCAAWHPMHRQAPLSTSEPRRHDLSWHPTFSPLQTMASSSCCTPLSAAQCSQWPPPWCARCPYLLAQYMHACTQRLRQQRAALDGQ
jgi:hypothetical protein